MALMQHVAKHFRDVHTGGNWTCSNLKDQLADVTWQQATTRVHGLNTIAALVYHVNYFVRVVVKVLEGGPLEGDDKVSFDVPPIHSEEEWRSLVDQALADAARFAELVERLPEERLWQDLADPKYGNWFRNLHGIIEHTHYHLGQIAVLKKIVQRPAGGE